MIEGAVAFVVPGAPVAKARARIFQTKARVRGGGVRTITRAATPAKTVAFERQVGMYARAAMGARAPFTGAIALCVECVFAPAPSETKRNAAALLGAGWHIRKPDADNVSKAVKDALRGIAFDDDSQVACLLVVKVYAATPCTRVTIRPIAATFADWAAELGFNVAPSTAH